MYVQIIRFSPVDSINLNTIKFLQDLTRLRAGLFGASLIAYVDHINFPGLVGTHQSSYNRTLVISTKSLKAIKNKQKNADLDSPGSDHHAR